MGQLEVTEKCSTERSITENKNVPIYVDENYLRAISEEEYVNIRDIGDRQKYQRIS